MEEALPIESLISELDLPAVYPDQGLRNIQVSNNLQGTLYVSAIKLSMYKMILTCLKTGPSSDFPVQL
jgi:hypothetical protein